MYAYELLIGKRITYGDGDLPEKALIMECNLNLQFPQNSLFLVQYEDGKKGQLSLETVLAGIIQETSPGNSEKSKVNEGQRKAALGPLYNRLIK